MDEKQRYATFRTFWIVVLEKSIKFALSMAGF